MLSSISATAELNVSSNMRLFFTKKMHAALLNRKAHVKLFHIILWGLFLTLSASGQVSGVFLKNFNTNGVKSAYNFGIAGVSVIATNPISRYFSSKSNLATPANWRETGANTTLRANRAYEVQIATNQAPLSNLTLTTADSSANDLIDNDATTSGANAVVNATLGSAGQNNHALGFGSNICVEPTLTFNITQATCGTNGYANNNASVTVTGSNFNKVNIAHGTTYYGIDYWSSGTIATLPIPNASTDVTYIVRAWNNDPSCYKDVAFVMPAAPTCPLPVACNAASGEIGGNVFRDFNGNGVRNTNETYNGVQNAEVKVYDCNGALLATTTTDVYGNYHFTGMPSSKVRIEFSPSVGDYKPSAAGTDNGSSVQFITAPDCSVDYGVNKPSDYCQDNPLVVAPCYLQGPVAGDVLVTFPYSYAGDKDGNINTSTTAFPSRNASLGAGHIATNAEIGTVYGLAYSPLDKYLYQGAFVKRKTQLGPLSNESTGAIYRQTVLGTPSVYADLNTIFGAGTAGTNPHPIATTNFDDDAATNPLVYKSGLGDLTISADFTKLYAVNLADKTVYVLPTDATPTSSNIVKLPLTTTGLPTAAGICPSADVRPFGLGRDGQGNIYLGGACSGESTQDGKDLAFYVWKLNGTSWDLVFNNNVNTYLDAYGGSRWRPWKPSQADDAGVSSSGTSFPMGIVADIEFDGDDMILGVRDFFGDITPRAFAGPGQAPYPRTTGDVIRAYKSGATYTMEMDAVAGTRSTVGFTPYNNTQFGTSTREYYFGDIAGDDGTEAAQGGLLVIPGRGEVMSTAFDAVVLLGDDTKPRNNYNTGGVQKYSHQTGDYVGAYDIYLSADLNTFGKTAGLGDIEALCDLQPIEIGNYVWLDTNKDGVQDPCETPLSNVTVELWKNGAKLAETTTNSGGNYYFSSKSNLATPANWTGAGADTTLQVSTTYEVRIATNQTPLSMRELTIANSTANNGNDQNDSDAAPSGGYAVISLTTSALGSVDHTLDFGFHCFEPIITSTEADTAICTNGVMASNAKVTVRGIINGVLYSYGTNGTTGLFAANATTLTADSIQLTGIANPSVSTTYTFRIWNTDTTCYNDTTVVLPVAVCPMCSLTTATFMQGNCQNNNTTAITTDDYFSVVVSNVSSTNGGTSGKYEVILNGTTVLNVGGTAYGTSVTVGGAGVFSSNGATTYQLKVRDLDLSGCETTVFTTSVSSACSTIPCPIAICLPVTVTRNN